MKTCLIGLTVFAIVAVYGVSNAFADKIYNYSEPGFSGQLTFEDTPDGIFMSIETASDKGHTCELSYYECSLKGTQYQCQPHEGGDPDMVPLVIKIMPDKSLRLQAAKGSKSPDGYGAFCGANGRLTGKYVPAR